MVRKLARDFLERVSFQGGDESSAAASNQPSQRGKIVGYDLGLLVYALTELDDPLADRISEKALRMVDPTGAWAEYYVGGAPRLTRCRPWESAINIEALLHWAEK
jgi:hypothetical protein